MFRDRTNLYISFRQSYTHHPYLNKSSLGPSSQYEPLIEGEAIEMDTLPPTWLDLASKVDTALGTIRASLGELSALHKKNALPGFDDRSADEHEIEQRTLRITQSLHKCQNIVKEFNELSKSESDAELRKMSENIRVAMATKIQEASTMFRKMQSLYLRQLRKDTDTGPDFVGGSSNFDQDVAMSEAALEQTQAFLQGHTDDQQLRQRELEINKISQGILEVAEIFRDLQTMVIDQGTLLDRIDYNVQTMQGAVQDADRELVKGAGYQKRTQKCKIILLLSLIVFGLLLVLILKPKGH